jgi:hypothetical protein
MNVTLRIPDDLAQRLAADGADLERRALEALAAEEFRARRMTKAELRRMLGIETRFELDAFLKARGIFEDYTMDDLEEERRTLERLGF